jgi:hypothetical protein
MNHVPQNRFVFVLSFELLFEWKAFLGKDPFFFSVSLLHFIRYAMFWTSPLPPQEKQMLGHIIPAFFELYNVLIMILVLQVPLLLSIGEEDTALTKATESGDTDLVYLVLFHIWQKVILPQTQTKFFSCNQITRCNVYALLLM